MGRAIEIGQREQLIALKKQGKPLTAISQELNLPLSTVTPPPARYKKTGHLTVNYANCGPKQPTTNERLYRASRWLKRGHPAWGAPLIHLKLLDRYGTQLTPSIRTLQQWFRQQHLSKPRQHLAQPTIGQAKAVHNIWQVDAKENLTLADGSPACYLTMTDEHSGAGLEAERGPALVFPPQTHQPGTA